MKIEFYATFDISERHNAASETIVSKRVRVHPEFESLRAAMEAASNYSAGYSDAAHDVGRDRGIQLTKLERIEIA